MEQEIKLTMPHHCVYVIELEEAVRAVKRFGDANPNSRLDKPCPYVGCIGHTPEQRFANHKAGIQAAPFVRRFGIKLKPRYYAHLNPMTYEAAAQMEIALANRLRSRGFAVWQK